MQLPGEVIDKHYLLGQSNNNLSASQSGSFKNVTFEVYLELPDPLLWFFTRQVLT